MSETRNGKPITCFLFIDFSIYPLFILDPSPSHHILIFSNIFYLYDYFVRCNVFSYNELKLPCLTPYFKLKAMKYGYKLTFKNNTCKLTQNEEAFIEGKVISCT